MFSIFLVENVTGSWKGIHQLEKIQNIGLSKRYLIVRQIYSVITQLNKLGNVITTDLQLNKGVNYK